MKTSMSAKIHEYSAGHQASSVAASGRFDEFRGHTVSQESPSGRQGQIGREFPSFDDPTPIDQLRDRGVIENPRPRTELGLECARAEPLSLPKPQKDGFPPGGFDGQLLVGADRRAAFDRL
jgi:hypothetical protein